MNARLKLPSLTILPARLREGLVTGPPDGLDLSDVTAGVTVAKDVPKLTVQLPTVTATVPHTAGHAKTPDAVVDVGPVVPVHEARRAAISFPVVALVPEAKRLPAAAPVRPVLPGRAVAPAEAKLQRLRAAPNRNRLGGPFGRLGDAHAPIVVAVVPAPTQVHAAFKVLLEARNRLVELLARLRPVEFPTEAKLPTQTGAVPTLPSLAVDPKERPKAPTAVVAVAALVVLLRLDVAVRLAKARPVALALALEEEVVESPKTPSGLPQVSEAVDRLVQPLPVLDVPSSRAEVGR